MRLRGWARPELLIPALAIAARLLPGPRTIDDAFITFRYARNLLEGNGLVFNPGEAVLGTTTPVYALLLSVLGLPAGVRTPFPEVAWLVNALADAATCLFLIRLASRLGVRRPGLWAAGVWAVAPMSVTFSIGGMETSLFVCLMTGTLYLHCAGRPTAAALTGALSLLTRPDALLFVVPLAADRLRQSLRVSRWTPDRRPITLRELAAFLVPVLAWAAIGTAYYGNPLPHSILAKVAAYHLPPEAALVRLLQHYATPFFEHGIFGTYWIAAGLVIYPVLFGRGALGVIRRTPSAWPAMAYPWFYLLAFSIANPLIFRWYLAPPLPMYMLGIFMGWDRLAQDLRRPGLAVVAGAASILLSLNAWTLRPDHGPDRPAPEMAFIRLELLYSQVASDLHGEIEPDQVVAAGDVGVLGYITRARILDTVGLNSPRAVGYYPLPDSFYVINYAIPPDLILDQEPAWVVLLESYGREGLLRDPAFQEAYELERTYPTDLYESEGLLVFRRESGR